MSEQIRIFATASELTWLRRFGDLEDELVVLETTQPHHLPSQNVSQVIESTNSGDQTVYFEST